MQNYFLMIKHLLWPGLLFFGSHALAHPMPSSIVTLSVLDGLIRGEAKIPLIELGNAVGSQRAANINDPFFNSYFTAHIRAVSAGHAWSTQVEDIGMTAGSDPVVGSYQEVMVRFTLIPPEARYLRTFTFNYDAVMHRVITHSALVFVRQDWAKGIRDDSNAEQIGIIRLDIPTEKIYPLEVNLKEGSWWNGCKAMISMGMQHIKEGTDHLLFLIVLLLPAMLLTNGRAWGLFGGVRYSVIRLWKIVTAFTVGHSVTLLVGALGWVKVPPQAVEIAIAFSILISAIHAISPVFPGKESYVAAGFGLIHGLAFATVLLNLRLSAGKLALSVLCFNAGIEIMQLFLIALIVPWLILLSKTPAYRRVRVAGASLAGVAAVAWMAERSTGSANVVTTFVQAATQYAIWFIAALAASSVMWYAATRYGGRNGNMAARRG